MPRRGTIRAGFGLVFRREWRRLLRSPFQLALSTLVLLVLMGVLMLVFNAGLATKLPIGVVDLDGSDLSRTIVRTVGATPDVTIAERYADLGEGRRAILSGRIHGLLLLPADLERDVLAGRRPEVVYFTNTQTLTTGNLALRGINAAVPAVAAGIRIALRTAEGQPTDVARAALQPIPVDVHPLFNPTLNYAHFLLAALIPALLQIIVVVATAFAVGSDVDTAHRLRVLGRLGGGIWPAMAGKLLPHTIVFLVVLGIADSVLFGVLGLPLRGEPALLLLADLLFVAACQLIGALTGLIVRPTGSAVGIATLLTAPAFGFMGIGFPRIAMNAFAYGWGALLPGTWFLSARIDQTIRGTPPDLSLHPILVLALFVVTLAGLTALKLEAIRAKRIERSAAARPVTVAP